MTTAARIRHLEHMVQVLKAQMRREESGGNNADVSASSRGATPVPQCPSVGSISQDTQSDIHSTGNRLPAGAMADQTRYVEVIHWEAVYDEVGIHGICKRGKR